MPTLHWIGKDKVINHHLDVPFRVLDYPDFIIHCKSGKTIVLETKGDHLDAEQKIRLGNLWASKAGNNFRYYMVYDRRVVDGAFVLDEFLKRIKDL